MTIVRFLQTALTALAISASGLGADEGLTRVEIGKIGKAATALIEIKSARAYGSAFCVHPSGLFLTNDHVAQGEVTLILNPGQKDEKVCKAAVIRRDKEQDLALLRIDGVKDLPTLAIGSDDKLTELTDLVAVGFPFGAALTANRTSYPEVSVNITSVSSIRRQKDAIVRIQLDGAINPGNSGGPVLDKNGKVVGVIVSGIQGSAVSFAIPAGIVASFVSRPDIDLSLPRLDAQSLAKPFPFAVRIVSMLPGTVPITADLELKNGRGKDRIIRMESKGDGKFLATFIPEPAGPDGPKIRMLARFDSSTLNAVTDDRKFKVGQSEFRLSEVRRITMLPNPKVVLDNGKTVEGAVTGLESISVRLGKNAVSVDLSAAVDVQFAPAANADSIHYTLVVREGDKELHRESGQMPIVGLLPNPSVARVSGIQPPELEGNRVIRRMESPVADVAVGGAGRYLILHLPKLRKLAVFDVNAAAFVGDVPAADDNVKFAAGLNDLVVLLPSTERIERWKLATLKRDLAVEAFWKGALHNAAMGCSSNGPLLVRAAVGNREQDKFGYSIVDLETLKVREMVRAQDLIDQRDFVHIRASANGQVFGLWCTSHTPNGLNSIILTDVEPTMLHGHFDVGFVLPTSDGKQLLTKTGRYKSRIDQTTRSQKGRPMIPACDGDQYLVLGNDGPALVHQADRIEPIHTIENLELIVPDEKLIKSDFTFDKRIWLISDAKLIVTIPTSNDRLVLHRIGR